MRDIARSARSGTPDRFAFVWLIFGAAAYWGGLLLLGGATVSIAYILFFFFLFMLWEQNA